MRFVLISSSSFDLTESVQWPSEVGAGEFLFVSNILPSLVST